MPNTQRPLNMVLLFVDEDEAWRVALLKHLNDLKREGQITLWDVSQIAPGTDCVAALEQHLKSASVILLLVSAACLAFHDREIEQALHRQKTGGVLVLPILLRPVDWPNTRLAHLQPLPGNGKPITMWQNEEAAFAEVVAGIRATLPNPEHMVVYASLPSTFPSRGGETSGPQEEALSERRKSALIVGVNNTQRSSLLQDLKYQDLKYAESDASEIAFTLRTSACKFVCFQTALTAEKAETQAVRRAVLKLAQQRSAQDLLLFYFLGYALPVRTKGGEVDIYLVTSDFDEKEVLDDANAYLSLRWLREKLYLSDSAARVLIILDCCYVQRIIDAKSEHSYGDIPQLIEECIGHPFVLEENGRWRIMLTGSTYTTPDQEREITNLLLAALRGDAQSTLDEMGNLYVHMLYTYMQDKTPFAQLPNLPENFPQSYVIATYRDKSQSYLQQIQQNKEDMRWNTVSQIMDEVKDIKNVITDSNYFRDLINTHFHIPCFDQKREETASLPDLSQEKVSKFFQITRVQIQDDFSSTGSDVDRLEQFGLLEGSHPTYGALLCFGLKPTRWLAGAFTRCTLWSTNDRHSGWQEAQDCRRDLITQFEFSRDFLQRHLRLPRVIGRDEELEIPLVALREALANALVHREYANQTSPVYVDIFYDRVEICSPGSLPEPMTIESLEAEHKSHPRNPQIARIFYLHQYVEKVGSGIQRMQDALNNAELEPAKFEVGKDKTFKVIFIRSKPKDPLRTKVSKLSEVHSLITNPQFFEKSTPKSPPEYFDHWIARNASFADLHLEKITEFFKRDSVRRQEDFRSGASIQDQLQDFGLLRDASPTYGALLCFGLSPTQWLPGASTRCTLWSGNDMNNGRLDTQDCQLDLTAQFDSSLTFLQKHLHLTHEIGRDDHAEKLDVPLIALEEALANALTHREYMNQATSVCIDIFDDRIEISNPGALPEPMTLDLLQEAHKSHPRNPQIARIFYLYQYVEKVGSGIQRMQDALSNAGLEPARFEIGKDKTFKVIFYRPKQSAEEHIPKLLRRRWSRRTTLLLGGTLLAIGGGGVAWRALSGSNSLTSAACKSSSAIGSIHSDGLLTPGVLSWGADPGSVAASLSSDAPYAFYDKNKSVIGFEADIASAIAKLMGISQECHPTSYKWEIEQDLQARHMDIILNGWEITPNRQLDESFSDPYYRYSQQLVVRANDSRFSQDTPSLNLTLTDLKSKGYKFGTGTDFKAADELRTAGINPYTSANSLDDLKQGRVDIIMIDTPIVVYYVQGQGKGALPDQTLRAIGKPLFPNNYVIGFKKNDPNADKLRQEINQALNALKQDGTLKRIYQEWGLWNDSQQEIGIVDCS